MLVYNITSKVHTSIAEGWVRWQMEEHIPEIMSTGLFTEYKFLRLLQQDDSDGPTYVVQYLTTSKENVDQYIEKYAPALRDKAILKWGDGFIAFRSLLESVH